MEALLEDESISLVVASQDWHPANHVSFASAHPSGTAKPFTSFDYYHPLQPDQPIKQELWPDHCVQGTRGAEIEPELAEKLEAITPGCLRAAGFAPKTTDEVARGPTGKEVILVQKGDDLAADGYSAFSLNGNIGFTNLPRTLLTWRRKSSSHSEPSAATDGSDIIDTLILCGLATDYCCLRTALDARRFGFRTIVVEDGMRGVAPDTVSSAWEDMKRWGCERVKTADEAIRLAQTRQT
ncbi:hypothetical protein OC846_005020 [Tilletia horrida]|uniref:nicotinamidase n=1 Tax=Tilletia horrida TaxID=155126 RepID=A0AAN6GM39_9BASI|nr:hypothetical protein OC846_005020 [Tilletia horrida]